MRMAFVQTLTEYDQGAGQCIRALNRDDKRRTSVIFLQEITISNSNSRTTMNI